MVLVVASRGTGEVGALAALDFDKGGGGGKRLILLPLWTRVATAETLGTMPMAAFEAIQKKCSTASTSQTVLLTSSASRGLCTRAASRGGRLLSSKCNVIVVFFRALTLDSRLGVL